MLSALLVLALAQAQPIQIAPATIAARANQPQLCAARDGTVWLTFGANDTIFVCSSKDSGRTFSPPVAVNAPTGKMPLGMRRGPRIAANKSRVVVSAIFGAQGGGKDGDLLAWRSSDGEKWEGPENVSDVPGAAREGLHAMGAGMDDAFVAVWLDLSGKGTKVMGCFSSNGGRDWSANKIVYESQSGTVCECCHPSLGFGPFGEVAAMFRNSLNGARDMYAATSPDGGRSWAPATKIGAQTWEIAACPMDGGAVSFDSGGGLVSVWRSKDKIYLGRGFGSTELAQGKNPWLAVNGTTPYLVWQSGTGVYYQVGTNTASRTRLAESGSDPVVVATKDGPVVAWRQNGSSPGVYVARLPAR
jgi:hypothetical protein